MTDRAIDLAQTLEQALAHHQAGRLDQAEAMYRRMLTVDPVNFNALHLLGRIANQRGNHDEALRLIEEALGQDASAYPAFNSLGLALRGLGNLEGARKCFAHALSLEPTYTEAAHNLALTLQAQGRLDEAAAQFRQVLSGHPDDVAARHNLGNVLKEQGHFDAAIECYRRSLALNPRFAEAHFSLGRAFEAQKRADDALAEYRNAIALAPQLAEAHAALGFLLQDQGMTDDALDALRAALALQPELVEARWGLAISELALFHDAIGDADRRRAAFSTALAELDRWFASERVPGGFRGVGTLQPYYIAYHQQNNRELLSRYGQLCARLMGAWQAAQGLAWTKPDRRATLHVGIVSAQIHDHPVWVAFVKGWIAHLDPRRFSTHIFHIGNTTDAETAFAKFRATHFVERRIGLRGWIDAILGAQLDVLIYPELGMDAMTAKLASLRLAPVQMAAWGHPETTGLPTIDYYLSAEDFEPADAQANYAEKLVPLPHIGCCYQALNAEAVDVDLGQLGIAAGMPLLLCPGTPFKYQPEQDWMLVEIARRLERCQFVFFSHRLRHVTERLQRRLENAFLQSGLDPHEYLVFVPWLPRPVFYGLLRRADVYLDTVGFSGFNTAMQAIECGLPVVTHEGRFMRGRLASGPLRRMGVSELVATSEGEYVDLAVRLARDAGYRQQVRARIEATRHVLFDDIAPVRALEDLLVRVTRD